MKFDLKSLFVLTLSLIFFQHAEAQDIKESEAYQRQKDIYQLGLKYGDAGIARSSLYNLITMDPNDASLLDSLAYMYFEYQQFTSCLLVCLDILKSNPDHQAALEMSAISYENLGLKDKALASYESIYLRNSSIYTLYKIAVLQLDLGRYGESMTNVNILLEREETKEAKLSINNQQGPSRISLEAAVYNLKGLVESSQGNEESARASYQQALTIEPEFTLAKNNLEDLDE